MKEPITEWKETLLRKFYIANPYDNRDKIVRNKWDDQVTYLSINIIIKVVVIIISFTVDTRLFRLYCYYKVDPTEQKALHYTQYISLVNHD